MPTLSSLMKTAQDAASVAFSEAESAAAKAAKEEAQAVTFAQIMAGIKNRQEGALSAQAAIQQLAQQTLGVQGGQQ